MKKQLLISLLACIAFLPVAKAQQTARYSNYLFNPLILNPAAAGSYDYINVMGIYRNQWTGLEGAPITAALSVDGSARGRTVGLGLQYINEKIGALRQNAIIPTAAYRVRVGDESWLSAGMSFGLFHNRLNGAELTFKDAASETSIPSTAEGVTYVDVNTGFYYHSPKLTTGLSIVNLFKPSLRYASGAKGDLGEVNRHYQFYVGYLIPINESFAIQPSTLLKTSEKVRSFQSDFAAILFYRNLVGAGLSYRNRESVNFILDFWVNEDFRLGYAFDITTSKIADYENGSHEIMLAYKLVTGKHIMRNPRNFYNN